MPPQCSSCGRFLSNAFVQGLLIEPAACPRCATTLTADQFHDARALQRAAEQPPEQAAEQPPERAVASVADPAPTTAARSVRPPDRPTEAVTRDEDRDVLEGWDRDRPPAAEARDRIDGAGTARAMATIVGAGVSCGLIAAMLAPRRRRDLFVGLATLLGAGVAVLAARQGDTDQDR